MDPNEYVEVQMTREHGEYFGPKLDKFNEVEANLKKVCFGIEGLSHKIDRLKCKYKRSGKDEKEIQSSCKRQISSLKAFRSSYYQYYHLKRKEFFDLHREIHDFLHANYPKPDRYLGYS